MTEDDDSDIVRLAQARTTQFQKPRMIVATTPNGPQRWPFAAQDRPEFKVMLAKTCLQCGAQVPTNTDGTVPDGAMPCGH